MISCEHHVIFICHAACIQRFFVLLATPARQAVCVCMCFESCIEHDFL